MTEHHVQPVPGDEVVELLVAPHPTRPPMYAAVEAVADGRVDLRCPNGHRETVALDRIGKARPAALWRPTGKRAT